MRKKVFLIMILVVLFNRIIFKMDENPEPPKKIAVDELNI